MSRQNKVNPGQYTQRGRLTPDDSARELVRQRTAIASQDKYQGRSGTGPWPGATGTPVNDDHDEPAERDEEASAPDGKPRNAARTATKTSGGTKSAAAPKKAPKQQVPRSAAKTTKKTAAKRSAARSEGASGRPPARKAALARSAVKRKKTARR